MIEEEKAPFRLRRVWPLPLVIYGVFRAIVTVVCMFPLRMARPVGRLLGRLICALDFKHRKLAHKNLTRTGFLGLDERGRARFIRRVYEHFGTCLVENLMLPKLVHGRRLLERTRLENCDIIDGLLAKGRGVIIVLGHMGNWEWGGVAVTMAGYPLNSIARTMEIPQLDRYLNRFRTLTGQKIIPKEKAMSEVVRALRRNEMLVVLADLDARHGGAFLPFLGQPASVVKSPAILSLRYGAPIVPVNVWRDGEGAHHVRFTEPLPVPSGGTTEEQTEALLRAMNARLEEFIREHPTQWMWLHGRWKTAGRVLREQADREAQLSAAD